MDGSGVYFGAGGDRVESGKLQAADVSDQMFEGNLDRWAQLQELGQSHPALDDLFLVLGLALLGGQPLECLAVNGLTSSLEGIRDLAKKSKSTALTQLASRVASAIRLSDNTADPFAK